jgi:hypothetical protein
MKFWVKFSRTIFKLAARSQFKKISPKLLEPVLAKSVKMLDDEMILEMKSFVISQQTSEGGFSDRAGNCDLYYSLFGYFIAESLSVTEVNEKLKKYISTTVSAGNLTGVYRYCGAILYAKLVGLDEVTEKLRKEIVTELLQPNIKQPEYSSFLAILALFYLEDYINVKRVVNRYKRSLNLKGHPCPVVAATAVMMGMAGNTQSVAIEALRSFYRGHGGFAAVLRAPEEDLLSTGVALFALHFLDADIRLIKPDCLLFVDDLYLDGGFRATSTDFITDVEYTFYGLLALGSMN